MIKRLIDRPIAVTMSIIAIVVLGIVAIGYLPVSLMPDIAIPKITIQVSSPGSSVREIDGILKPIKGQLSQVVGVENITSEARSDAGVIFMTFEPGSNIDLIFIEVNEKIDRSMSVDSNIERPKILKASATDIPAFYLNLTLKNQAPIPKDSLPSSGVRFTELGNFARDVISKRIEQQRETAMVDISGVTTPELLCIPDYKKLTSMGVGVEILETAIKNNNIQLGALSIKDGIYRYNIHFDSNITTKEDIENIYINHNGRIFQFSELCEVVERSAKRSGMVRSGKENSVTMAIIKQNDSKMEDLQASMNKLIKNLEKEYPNISFELTRDQTKLLTYSIDHLKDNLIFGALLACIVIFFFMKDFRSPILIIITIPLSLIITLLTFHILGITINIISLSGLVLGVGMMVDNSIIVIDNITQKWQQGLPIKDAISTAVNEIFTPMLSSVLTTCSVFLPLIFLSGVAGALFYDQAMAVTIALFSSLVVSSLVIPVYFYVFYKHKNAKSENKYMSKYLSINYYKPYEIALKWVLRNQAISFILFFLTFPAIYFVYNEIGKDRLPLISHDDTVITIDWNSGISLEENDKRIGEILNYVSEDVEQSTSMIGSQQFLLSHTPDITHSEAIVYVKTKDKKELSKVQNKIESYITSKYPKGVVTFNVSGNIFDMIFSENESKLIVELQKKNGKAPDVKDVNLIIAKISEKLPYISIAPVVVEQNIRYIADVEAMSIYNITYEQIKSKLQNVISQKDLFKINQGGYSVPVTTGDSRIGSADILSTKVMSSDGVEVPLNLIITETKGEDFKRLYSGKSGDYYPIRIEAEDSEIDDIMTSIEEVVNNEKDFFISFSGGYFSSRKMVNELSIILIVAVLLLYFILAAQFESIIQPLIILSEIVIDIFWVMLVLLLLGETLNLMSLIGIVVMSGIIINDSILKVDTINRLRKDGASLIKAVFVAGHSRLKPIIMTSLTTILALSPFLHRVDMGSDLQYPLSLSIITGMIIGTVISLLFIPLAYYAIYKKRR